VNLSLKPVGGTPGDLSAEQMAAVADLAEVYGSEEIRVSHRQNLVLPHVKRADLYRLWEKLSALELATPNIGLVTDTICCPGLDYCGLATARSIPIAQQISERFKDLDRLHQIGEVQIKMSGCINACGHHHVGHIGILGLEKAGEEFYQVTLGGAVDEDAALGAVVGRGFSATEVVDAVETILDTYVTLREEGERFIETFRRVGLDPFKQRLYAAD
jgi:sulfite reductase (NADPH) hemoprotein beta-component